MTEKTLASLQRLADFISQAESVSPRLSHVDGLMDPYARGTRDTLHMLLRVIMSEMSDVRACADVGARLRELDIASRRHARLMPDVLGMVSTNVGRIGKAGISAAEALAAYETLAVARRERQHQRQPVTVRDVPLGHTREITPLAVYLKGEKPPAPGVYRRLFETRMIDTRTDRREWFCFWNGFEWGAGQVTPDDAYIGRGLKGDTGPLCWRGRPGDGKPFPLSDEFVLAWLSR